MSEMQSIWSSSAQIATGSTTVLISASSRSDPFSGYSIERRYRGSQGDLEALQIAYIDLNWQTSLSQTGSPFYELIVSIPNSSGGASDSESDERWEFDIAFKQQDLFANLGVIKLLGQGGITNNQIADEKIFMKKQIDAGVSTESFADIDSITTQEIIVYEMLIRGQEFVEIAQPVLTRKRVYGPNFSGSQLALGGTIPTNTFWSGSALISAFGIPSLIAGLLTDVTDAAVQVSGYAFGWKLRKNNLIIIPAKNKIEETVDWEFDQWSEAAYTYNG